MKFYTPALMNIRPKGLKALFKSQRSMQKHYRAVGKNEDITLLWIESSRFGTLHCYPCVLDEAGDKMVFRTGGGKERNRPNAEMITRWNLFVNQQNILTDFEVEEMVKAEFYSLYRDTERELLAIEIAAAEAAAGIAPPAALTEGQPAEPAEEQPAAVAADGAQGDAARTDGEQP